MLGLTNRVTKVLRLEQHIERSGPRLKGVYILRVESIWEVLRYQLILLIKRFKVNQVKTTMQVGITLFKEADRITNKAEIFGQISDKRFITFQIVTGIIKKSTDTLALNKSVVGIRRRMKRQIPSDLTDRLDKVGGWISAKCISVIYSTGKKFTAELGSVQQVF